MNWEPQQEAFWRRKKWQKIGMILLGLLGAAFIYSQLFKDRTESMDDQIAQMFMQEMIKDLETKGK